MSSRKNIRQAPGRLLRQKLINLLGSRSSGNCAFKQPETTDIAQSVSQEWNCAFKHPETHDTTLWILNTQSDSHKNVYKEKTKSE